MLLIEENLYYRICDDCGDKKEIKRGTYNAQKRKGNVPHYCLSCCQKGERNHAKGKTPWNKGLTKETDERVKQYGENGSKTKISQRLTPWNKGLTKETDERVKQYSETMAASKKGKPNYKLRRKNFKNMQFKYIRQMISKRLYNSWTKHVLERDDFKCTICNDHKKLEVHHTYPFRNIYIEEVEKMGLMIDEYNEWSDKTVEELIENILRRHSLDIGVTLCCECHAKVDEHRRRFIKNKERLLC